MSQSQLVRIFILLTLCLVACDPGQPVTVRPVDAGVEADMEPMPQDQAVPDFEVDSAIEVDANTADAALPDYVEALEPNVAPDPTKIAVTGEGDLFRLYWWRGGRMWHRSFTANFEAALGDEERIETVLVQEPSAFLRFIPPYTEATRVLRPTTWPSDEAGYLVVSQDGAWQNYHLSSTTQSTLGFAPTDLRSSDHNFGPTDPSSAIIAGVIEGRVHTVEPTSPELIKPIGERDAPLPVSIAPMGHLWLLGYADGHCASFTSNEGMGDEVGNWRCFADGDTHILGRASLASDDKGPAMVSHRVSTLHIWDPRPGLVTNPWLITPTIEMSPEDSVSTGLPEGWGMYEVLGHQILNVGTSTLSFHARRAQTLVYVAESEDSTYWVLVSRSRIVIVEKSASALSAMLVLGSEPAHLLWDGVEGVLNAVALSVYAHEPLLSVAPDACASRSPETCGLADADCDGDSEGGVCCPFVYSHSEVSTLSEVGAFNGPWFVSKSDLGALLAVHRAGRIELMHATNDSDQCFACASGVGPIQHFAHTNAVVAVVTSSADEGAECPSACSVINAVQGDLADGDSNPNAETDDEGTGGEESSGGSEGEPTSTGEGSDDEASTNSQLLVVHPTPGQLVVQPLACDTQLLESVASDTGVRILAFCLDRALEYQVLDGALSETPLTIDIGVDAAVWVGAQTKSIIGGRYVAQWLTAHGSDLVLKAWSFGVDGLIEEAVPEVLVTLPLEARQLPIRFPITENGLITRLADANKRLEFLHDHQWINVPSHLWVESIQFSKYEDFALTVAALRDPTQPGFDPIEQTLAVYGHDLGGVDSPWGQHIELESSPILGYSFQGAILPEWSHYALDPNVWWSVGRDNVAPTIKRLGLNCEPTTRLEAQKSE